MSVRLVILGLLRDRPLYGYEIKHIIEEHMSDWTSIAFGSIYFALNKLADEKFIEKIEVEQQGKRPSRDVYQITDSGRDEFKRLLRSVWKDMERQYYSIDIGLAFMEALPPDEIRGYMQARVKQLEWLLEYLDQHEKEEMTSSEIPPSAVAVFDHSRIHFKAELQWMRGVLDQFERDQPS
jgi:DNA-binding PadR family transcriptional regulator